MLTKEIFIFAVAILFATFVWRKWRFFYLASKIPQTSLNFSWKYILFLLSDDTKKIFQLSYEAGKNCKGITKTWCGPFELFVQLNDPEDIKIVWNSKEAYDKPDFVKNLGLNKGSGFGDIKYWHSHRKILDSHFGTQNVKKLFSIFNEKSKVLTARIAERVGQGEFDVVNYVAALSIESILNMMELEVDIQNLDEKTRDLTFNWLKSLTKLTTKRVFRVWLRSDFIFQRTKSYAQLFSSHPHLDYANKAIKNAREKLENVNEDDEKKPSSFVRALMDPEHNLSQSEIVDEILTISLAGQDTSAITMSSVILLLAMHKNIQNKLVAELYEILGKSTEAPYLDFETLNNLPYLEMVLNESLRLFPAAPLVSRKANKEIPVTRGYSIPPEAYILVPIFVIHRNKLLWGDDAEEFRPERFEKENFKKIHPYAFIPFAKGPRMCVGYRYAKCLMKVLLINFLMKYEVDTSLKYEEVEFEANLTLIVSQGFRISIRNRE